MALIPGKLITSARARHPAFTEQRHPTPALVDLLSEWQLALRAEIAGRNASAIAEVLAIALPFPDGAAGALLPPRIYIRGGEVVGDDGSRAPFALVPLGNRSQPRRQPWEGYVEGDRLHLLGSAREWERISAVTVDVVTIPADLAGPSDPLALPDLAREAVVAALVKMLAERTPPDAGVPVGSFTMAADTARAAFLRSMGNQRKGHVWRVRPA